MTRKERKQREVRINIIAQEHVEAREHIEKINELKEESRGCSLRALFWGLVAALMAVTALLHAFSLDYPELNSKLKIIEEASREVIHKKESACIAMYLASMTAVLKAGMDKTINDIHLKEEEDTVLEMGRMSRVTQGTSIR